MVFNGGFSVSLPLLFLLLLLFLFEVFWAKHVRLSEFDRSKERSIFFASFLHDYWKYREIHIAPHRIYMAAAVVTVFQFLIEFTEYSWPRHVFFLNITFDSVNRRTHHTGALDQIASIHMFNVPKSVQFIFRVDGLRPHHTKWCFLGHDKLNHYYSLKPSKMIWTKVLKQRQQTPLKRA